MATWDAPPRRDDVLQRIQSLEHEGAQTITDQHVVSRVLLKGFAAPGPQGSGWQLTPFDVIHKRELKARGLRGCAKVPNLLTYASASAEKMWSTVENCLEPAIQKARAGSLLDGAAETNLVKDAIALHLVRSERYLEIHHAAAIGTMEEVRRDAPLRRASLLQTEFYRRFGLHAGGPDSLQVLLDEPLARWEKQIASGALARVSMESMFNRVRAMLRPLSVQTWHTPVGYELLISDSPSFTFRYNADHTSIDVNMAIGDSHGIALPLANDCLVSIGPAASDDDLAPNNVELFNTLQVKVARQYVYYRPGSQLSSWVPSAARAYR